MLTDALQGRKNRFVYTTAFSGSGPYFDALQKYDLQAGTTQTRRFAPGEWPSEVAFVPAADRAGPEDAGCVSAERHCSQQHGERSLTRATHPTASCCS